MKMMNTASMTAVMKTKMTNKESEDSTMKVSKKIVIGAVAVVSSAAVVTASAKAVVGKLRRKWFADGFEAGRLVERVESAAENAHKQAVIEKKYNKLCKEYDELQNEYNEMLDYYAES